MMAFREKTAWLAIAGMLLGYVPFFLALGRETENGGPTVGRFLLLLAIASLVRIVIEVGGRTLVAVRMGAEARGPADERDRAISARSSSIAYIVLLVGMIVVGMFMPFSNHGIAIVTAALIAIVAAELIRYLAIALSYRLGWQ
jgi:NhaP-type Na+/H+ or K+/H+ antiporter